MKFILTLLIVLIPFPVYTKNWNFGFALDWFNILYILIFIGWFTSKISRGEKIFQENNLNLPIAIFILFFVFAFVRGLFGPYEKEFFVQLISLKRIIFSIFLFYVFVNNVKNIKDVNFFVFIIIAVMCFEAYICLKQHYPPAIGEEFSWDLKREVVGTFGEKSTATANEVGTFFAQYIPFLLGIALCTKKVFKKFFLFFVVLLTSFPLLWSYSRGSWLAVVFAIAFLGFAKDKKLLIILLVLFALAPKIFPKSVIERTSIYTSTGELDNTSYRRKMIIKETLHAMTIPKNLIFGIGFNNATDYIGIDTHNIYMRFLLEFGIFGTLIFIFLLYKSFLVGWCLFKTSSNQLMQGLGLGFSACVISLAIDNFTGTRLMNEYITNYFWILLGSLTKLNLIYNKRAV